MALEQGRIASLDDPATKGTCPSSRHRLRRGHRSARSCRCARGSTTRSATTSATSRASPAGCTSRRSCSTGCASPTARSKPGAPTRPAARSTIRRSTPSCSAGCSNAPTGQPRWRPYTATSCGARSAPRPMRSGWPTARQARGASWPGWATTRRLRDFGRLGLLMLHDGKRGDAQVLPAGWIEDRDDDGARPAGRNSRLRPAYLAGRRRARRFRRGRAGRAVHLRPPGERHGDRQAQLLSAGRARARDARRRLPSSRRWSRAAAP